MLRVLLLNIFFLFSLTAVYAQAWQDSLFNGKSLYNAGDFEGAYHAFLAAQKLAPKEVDLSSDIGNAAYRNGDFENAEKAFKAAANQPKAKEELGKQWHNVGNSQFNKNDYQAAIESYKNALRYNAADDKARHNLAAAKRKLLEQEQQEQQQQQQQQSPAASDENEGGDKEEQQGENLAENEQPTPENSRNPSNNGEQSDEGEQDAPAEDTQLSDRKTQRILDELLKQEMETKERVKKFEAKRENQEVKSGKRW